MKPIPTLLFLVAMFVGCVVVIYAGVHGAAEAYAFWKYGIESEATVLSLDDIYHGRGGKTYYYKLAVLDEEYIDGFSYELSIGDTITVLVLPESPGQVALGDEESSLFEIFSLMVGGWIWAILIVVFELFLVGWSILLLVFIWHTFWRVMLNEQEIPGNKREHFSG